MLLFFVNCIIKTRDEVVRNILFIFIDSRFKWLFGAIWAVKIHQSRVPKSLLRLWPRSVRGSWWRRAPTTGKMWSFNLQQKVFHDSGWVREQPYNGPKLIFLNSFFSCGVVASSDPDYEITKVDFKQPYPECCPHIQKKESTNKVA